MARIVTFFATIIVWWAAATPANIALAGDDAKPAPGQAAPAAADDGSAATTAPAAPAAPADKVHYQKQMQVDFSKQTIEGKLHRPDAALITASESANANGLLRLREDFLDQFTAFCAEDAP